MKSSWIALNEKSKNRRRESMGRVISPLAPGAHMLDRERVSRPKLRHSPNYWHRLNRKIGLKRTPLKKESKGHKAELAKYNASAPAFFAEPGNDVCHICLRLREDGDDILLRPATERHHKFGRIGRLLNWRPGWIPSCRPHRSWPHEHPARARRLGLLCEAKDWCVFPGLK